MLFGQRPVSMFPSYTYRPEYSQPSPEERYYRHLAGDHNRRADAALRLAQQERERAARERELEALRERQYQEELPRRALLRQQSRNGRPHSQFFGAFEGQHPRAEERSRRQSQSDDAESRRFSTFLNHLFQHQQEDAEEEIPVPKKVSDFSSDHSSFAGPNPSTKQARFDHDQRTAHPRPQFTRPETKAKSPAPEAPQMGTREKPAAVERPPPSVEPTVEPHGHAASFAALDAIQSQFDTLKATFTFPSNAEFAPSASASSEVPKLTYSSVNAPVHQYENDLVKLLTKLDGVESDGAESIRGARKALVIAVEKELDRVDGQKRDALKKSLPVQPEPASSTDSEPAADSTSEEQVAAQAVQDSSVEAMEVTETVTYSLVAAASVPLPQSDDMELEVESENVEPRQTRTVVDEDSAPIVPETAAPGTSVLEPTVEGVAPSVNDDIFAKTPEALAGDSASESEESGDHSEENRETIVKRLVS